MVIQLTSLQDASYALRKKMLSAWLILPGSTMKTLGKAELLLLCGISPSIPSFPTWTGICELTITRMPNKDININKDYESFRLYIE